MSHFIEVNGVANSPQRISVDGLSGLIGSDASCPIRIAHAEVAKQAVMLDFRGKEFWVQNLNPYSIFVGMDEVTSNSWAPWAVEETIQLTQSVSLTMRREAAAAGTKTANADSTTGESKGLDVGKIIQVVLIGACFLGAPLILFSKSDDVGGEIDKKFNFNEIVEQLDSKSKDVEYEAVRKYLQQAWMADRRYRNKNPQSVMKYYELLVSHRLIRVNPTEDPTLNEIAGYATRRLSELRFKQ